MNRLQQNNASAQKITRIFYHYVPTDPRLLTKNVNWKCNKET